MYTSHHPCWDAKNRDNLPEELPMEYESIKAVIEHSLSSTAKKVEQYMPESSQMDFVDYKKEQQKKQEEAEKVEVTNTPDMEELQGDKSKVEEAPQSNEVSKYFSDPECIPKALRDLMEQNDVGEWEIQTAVMGKGYYPEGTLIQDMDPAFVEGVLVAAWPQVFEIIKEIKKNQAVAFN